MKRLLGLLLVLGVVGCGGGEAPQQMGGSSAAAPSNVPNPDVPQPAPSEPDVAKPSGKELHTLSVHATVTSVAFSPDGQQIVSGS